MTREELLVEINRLTLDERLELLEELSRDIRKTLHSAQGTGSPVDRVRGLLRSHDPLPSEEQIKRDYTDYLESKYS